MGDEKEGGDEISFLHEGARKRRKTFRMVTFDYEDERVRKIVAKGDREQKSNFTIEKVNRPRHGASDIERVRRALVHNDEDNKDLDEEFVPKIGSDEQTSSQWLAHSDEMELTFGKNRSAAYFFRSRIRPTSKQILSEQHANAVAAQPVEVTQKAFEKLHARELRRLRSAYARLYPWYGLLLNSGYNLLFYGVGSKRKLLEGFFARHEKDGPLVVVDAFRDGCNCRDALKAVASEGLGYNLEMPRASDAAEVIRSIYEADGADGLGISAKHTQQAHRQRSLRVGTIRKLRESRPPFVYLLIHDLASTGFRSRKAMEALALVASVPQIRVIASVEHVLAPALWDCRLSTMLNFVYIEMSTFESYAAETSLIGTVVGPTGSATQTLNSRLSVIEAVPQLSRAVFRIIAKEHLDHEQGLSFERLLKECQKAFIVHQGMQLRSHLRQFIDHKLVRTTSEMSSTSGSVETLEIPMSKEEVVKVLECMDERGL